MAIPQPTQPQESLVTRPFGSQPNSGIYNQGALNNSTNSNLNNLNNQLNAQNTNLQNNYKQAVQTNTGSYQNIMDRYNSLLGGGQSYAAGYGVSPNIGQASTMQAPQINAQNQMDPNTIAQFIQSTVTNARGTPATPDEIQYLTGKIQGVGGLGDGGKFWLDKITQDYGHGGGGSFGGGISSYGSNFQMPDFSQERGGYANLANGGNRASFDPEFRGALSNAIGGYGEFAKTGGFSPQDIANIRARDIAPTRSIYAQGQAELNRNRALQGGYSPNFAASQAKMAREMSSQISDANVNANAGIAQMVQQGKLAGLGGLTSTGAAGQGLQNNIDSLNAQQIQAGLAGMTGIDSTMGSLGLGAGQLQLGYDTLNSGNQLKALAGMTDLYSATPGLSKMFGDQALQASGQQLQGQGLQNQLDLGLGEQEIQRAGLPSGYQKALGNIASTASLVGQGAGAANALGITGGSAAPAVLGTGTSGVAATGATPALAGSGAATLGASATPAVIGAGTIGGASALPAAGGITGASLGGGTAANLGGSAAASGLGSGGSAGLAGGGSAAAGGGAALAGTIAGYAGGILAPYLIGRAINPGPMHAGESPENTYQNLVQTLGKETVDGAIASNQQEAVGLPPGWQPYMWGRNG